MNFELKGYRSLILVGLGLLALLLGLMINKLFSEYQDLLIVEDTIFTGQDYYFFLFRRFEASLPLLILT